MEIHPMQGFTAMHFVFVCEALDDIKLDAQPGTAIRGALYHALINIFSPKDPIPGLPLDPVRELLAAEDETHARGRDVPRAFAVEPPPAYTEVTAGEGFSFGVSLYGSAERLMPYLFRAVPEMGRRGIGRGRGRFRLMHINEISPLNGATHLIMQKGKLGAPSLTVTHPRIVEEASKRQAGEVTLHFLTPMRLIEGGSLVHTPRLGTLLRRLIERAQALVEFYQPDSAIDREVWRDTWRHIGELGNQVDAAGMLMNETQWVNVQSYSQARGRATPIGGIVGKARWHINSPEVLVWLLWGQSLHVGKNAAKGDGYFRVE